MNYSNHNRGFGPLVVILVVAIAAAVGGGVYYTKKQSGKPLMMKGEEKTKVEGSSNASMRAKGSLRALLSLGGSQKCLITGTSAQSSTSGTVYVSGSMFRGDFTSNMEGRGEVQSHMIRTGNDVFVWSGSQGAKMNIDAIQSAGSSAQGQAQGQVDVNQEVDYECESWNKDEAMFAVPTNINFVDIAAMMQAAQNMQGKINVQGMMKSGN